MDYTLEVLADTLSSNLKILKGPLRGDVMRSLHDQSLPLKKSSDLAARVVDLLTEIRLLLDPASLILADHFLGYTDSQCLTAAVKLEIADILDSEAKSIHEIADRCNASPSRLGQVMRVLRNKGIFHYESTAELYSNNHVSSLLRRDNWTQWHRWVRLYGTEFYDIATRIPDFLDSACVRTPAQMKYDTDESIVTYLSRSELGRTVHETLSAGAIAQSPGILEDYPWDNLTSVLDVGGGTGGFVTSLLRKFPAHQAGILDIPSVIGQARAQFFQAGGKFLDVGDRVRLFEGNFFRSVPPWENYVIKWCLHNWHDKDAARILETIRRSIIVTPSSRLVVLESIVGEGHANRITRYADLNMMMTIGGCERSGSEWHSLAESSGWKVNKIFPLRNAWLSAIELIPVSLPEKDEQIEGSVDNDGEKSTSGDVAVSGRRYQTKMSFLEPWDVIAKSGEPFFRSQPAEGLEKMNFQWVEHTVEVEDVRRSKDRFNINDHSFAFVDDPISLTDEILSALRSNSSALIQELYYPAVRLLVRRLTGADKVLIFDHTVRKRDPNLEKGSNPDGQEQPATIVHCDQSERGAIKRLKENLSPEEDVNATLRKRIQLINVWRPIQSPVLEWPLALMEFDSLRRSDIHPCDLLRGEDEFRGQTLTFCHDEAQRWYYLDKQTMDEVTLIKIWDNKAGVAQRKSHCFCISRTALLTVLQYARTVRSSIQKHPRQRLVEKA